jgi:enoyl-[acyl-carrier protein] reductase II
MQNRHPFYRCFNAFHTQCLLRLIIDEKIHRLLIRRNRASAEEMKELLGKGRSKKGIFEGNLQEGELEIGQVASLFREMQTVSEVMKEIMEDFRKGMEKIQLAL